jgi:hypothetical protein
MNNESLVEKLKRVTQEREEECRNLIHQQE